MNEHLVGYILGSLDPVTHARVEAHLHSHPETAERVGQLRQLLAPLDDSDDVDPPPGLVHATLARVAEYRCKLPTAPASSPAQQAVPPRRTFRPIDWVAAAVVLFLLGGLAVPFVAQQWQLQQRTACANNLRKFWVALAAYSDRSQGDFPRIEADGPRGIAGIFVPMLRDAGVAQDVSIGCPGREVREPLTYTVADLERMHVRAPEQYRAVSREIGGNYAYCLGYQEGNTLYGLRRDSTDRLPILSDCAEDTTANSRNHAGRGQNVLFVGGNVRWATDPAVGLEGDHIFVNHHNRVQAGVCRIDSVLGTSAARPYVGE